MAQVQPAFQILRCHGLGKVVALDIGHTLGFEKFNLRLGFSALGHPLATGGVFQGQDKLIPTPAGNELMAPGTSQQTVGYDFQKDIPYGVSQGVIDDLEAVQVHKQHRRPLPIALAALQGLVQRIHKTQSVRQAGQRIVVGKMEQLFFGLLGLGDVREHGNIVLYFAVRIQNR
jgi:hypothetical protein